MINAFIALGLAPVLFSLLVSLVIWRRTTHRTLLAVVALLCFSGLQSQIYPIVLDAFSPSGTSLAAEVVAVGFAMIVGSLVIFWLHAVLRAPNYSSKPAPLRGAA